LNNDLTVLKNEKTKLSKDVPRIQNLNISLSVNRTVNVFKPLTTNHEDGPLRNDTHNYVDENNVFGFWNLKLIDMFNNKYFNINWTRYEVLAKRDFNITDQDFSWDLVDQKLDEFMISTENLHVNQTTIHEFNKLKKKYYNWINVLNDNGNYFWNVRLSEIDKNKDFQKIWNWGSIRNKSALLTGQNSSNLNWDLVENKIYNYMKNKSLYYYNYNFTSDLVFESFIDEVITIKAKYTDYEFLMNNNFYFRDIETDSEFKSNLNWTRIETKIRILLNVTDDEDLNMTQVDVIIKEYEFNSRNFTAKETVIIKDLITVERKYREYLSKTSGIDNGKNSTSNGLMSDIGNNIHQGTSMSILFSL
jgi:hypothetical protein